MQAQRIAQAVKRGASAILISVLGRRQGDGRHQRRRRAGVPVMTFDSDAPQSKRFAYYGVDDASWART